MIGILNYGIGNISSIQNMFYKIGHESIVASTAEDLMRSDKIVLPGVGHYDYGMKLLRNTSFFTLFQYKVRIDKVPLLGICLGAQMLMESSEEGIEKGLGFIKGECKRFDKTRMNPVLPVPNMGWADVDFIKETSLNTGIIVTPRYYFVHSYHMCCHNEEDVLATSHYGYKFTAAVSKENIYGVQFHPEKSHKFGMEVFKNFAGL